MSLKSTHFSSISFRTCYARWCADSLVARRHFALSRFDFRSFRVSVGRMTPGRGGYQSTNLPYTNEQIPESYESLADSNVSYHQANEHRIVAKARGVKLGGQKLAQARKATVEATPN